MRWLWSAACLENTAVNWETECARMYIHVYIQCVGLSFRRSPDRHYFHITEWMSFLLLSYIYRQKKPKKKKTGFPPPEKRSHRFTGRLSASWISYLHWQQKKKKKVQLFWHRCFGHTIPTLEFILFFFVPVMLHPDCFVSPYRKKGRFVVVLPLHLQCSPFKEAQVLL